MSAEDKILDLGCGDGILTQEIATAASKGEVLGLDSSPNFITSATRDHGAPNCRYAVQDCAALSSCPEAVSGRWDKVFSNAALHWILREPTTRETVFRDIHSALRTGGLFVCEFGGKGNIAEVHAAVLSALVQSGVEVARAREACPWFFPSEVWLKDVLVSSGFEVLKVETEYRPTKLTPNAADGSGGLEGWIRLMCAEFLATVDESKRDEVVGLATRTLETIVTREEDGSQWIGYVRLRAVARKA